MCISLQCHCAVYFLTAHKRLTKVIYTTNAIESINMSLRKVIKTRASFPTDEAVTKLFYLALNNISKKWTMPIRSSDQACSVKRSASSA